MQKAIVTLASAAVLASYAGLASAEISGNVAATSEYMFRGIESSGGAAVQGGLTWSGPSGLYVGGWASNITGSANEYDIILGWSADVANGVSLDLGAIYYLYTEQHEAPGNPSINFPEIYAGLSFAGLSAKVYYAHKFLDEATDVAGKGQEEIYTTLSYAYPIQPGLDIGLQVGYSAGDGVETFFGDDYIDYSVSLSKDLGSDMSASVALVGTNLDSPGFTDKPKFVVSFSKGFTL